MNSKNKIYIIHSEYVQNGMTFNRKTRYVLDAEKANSIYEETLKQMKEENSDMVEDKENYMIEENNRKGNKYFCCYYKYQYNASNFLVEIYNETLE